MLHSEISTRQDICRKPITKFSKLHEIAQIRTSRRHSLNYRRSPWKDPSFFRNRDRSRDDENRSKPYYGIGKLGRLPNSWLVAFLFAVTAVGVALQAVAIRHSMTLRRSALDEASARHSVLHTKMQEQAHDAGNHNNLRMMHSRLGGTSAGFALLMKDGNRELAEKQPVEKPPSPIKVVDDLPAVDAKAASIG
ncbi:uncharacterized protein LOC124717128 isoform X2 [Schistocerca piceifrons]|uniref:uncharacterized protein LOC124717128 isoform X2 n=1 Tax=Schistocerca piceifrons TaxID=274613 RepID=UPI001F5E4B96|nr:uncharacterized protein LOC124717128 isoform X2 [Schistocerca piceifrons]